MTRVIAIRHGQASAGTHDYDRLSELGVEQSRRLGRWLDGTGIGPGRVLIGRMRRHRQTLEAMREYSLRSLPDAEVLEGLDEFDHEAVLRGFCRRFPDHPASAIAPDLWQAEPRQIAALIRAALQAWSQGELDGEQRVESWGGFGQRVQGALQQACMQGHPEVLLVTSGGVLSQLALLTSAASQRDATDLMIGLRNSAVCEFRVEAGRLHLHGWDDLPHLAEAPELWTYY